MPAFAGMTDGGVLVGVSDKRPLMPAPAGIFQHEIVGA